MVIQKLKVLRVSDAPPSLGPSTPDADGPSTAVVADVDDEFDNIVMPATRSSAAPSRAASPATTDVNMAELPGSLADDGDADSTKKRRKGGKGKEAVKGGKK